MGPVTVTGVVQCITVWYFQSGRNYQVSNAYCEAKASSLKHDRSRLSYNKITKYAMKVTSTVTHVPTNTVPREHFHWLACYLDACVHLSIGPSSNMHEYDANR